METIVECNGGLWRLDKDNYKKMLRALSTGDMVRLTDFGTQIGTVTLSVGSISRQEAARVLQEM